MTDIDKFLLGRSNSIFFEDIKKNESQLNDEISKSKFLVLGGGGTIGQSTVKELFARSPQKLHVVDLSENNLVELTRDLRSSIGYIGGEYKTFAIDIGSVEYDFFWESDGDYDYVLNFSALKHVRSEKDPFSLMRMINVNILNVEKTLNQCITNNVKKYFCVSTDKASNPVNLMGATKRIMEILVHSKSNHINTSSARFANVLFSNGSLLEGFKNRLEKKQPLTYPSDIQRYFISSSESGELCLLSSIMGKENEIYFPKIDEKFNLINIKLLAENFLLFNNYKEVYCENEDEARDFFRFNFNNNLWPCFISNSDTSGEKPFEQFFTNNQKINFNTYERVGVIENENNANKYALINFIDKMKFYSKSKYWKKQNLIRDFKDIVEDLNHLEKGKNLDQKM